MAIDTYDALTAAIQEYSETESIVVSQRLDDMILNAERRIAYGYDVGPFRSVAIRCRAMEANANVAVPNYLDAGTSGGTANAQTATATTISNAVYFVAGLTNTSTMTFVLNGTVAGLVKKGENLFDIEAGDIVAGQKYHLIHNGVSWHLSPDAGAVPLPSRFNGMRAVYNGSTPLDFIHSDDFKAAHGNVYTIDGNFLVTSKNIAAGSSLEIKYYRAFPPLSERLNDLFLTAPHIYLWAGLLESALFVMDNESAVKWHGLLSGAIEGFSNSDKGDSEGRTRLFLNTHKAIV